MKKIWAVILLLIGVLLISGCGNKTENDIDSIDKKASIITNSGETISMSAKDLMDVYDANEAKFIKDYKGAKITFTGTVNSIDIESNVIVKKGGVTSNQNRIIFEEGWCLVLGSTNDKYDLADYNKGDKLEVTTGIVDATDLHTDFLKSVVDKRCVWLVGNDRIYYDSNYTNFETEVIKK